MSTQRQLMRVEALKLAIQTMRFDDSREWPLDLDPVIGRSAVLERYIDRGIGQSGGWMSRGGDSEPNDST